MLARGMREIENPIGASCTCAESLLPQNPLATETDKFPCTRHALAVYTRVERRWNTVILYCNIRRHPTVFRHPARFTRILLD